MAWSVTRAVSAVFFIAPPLRTHFQEKKKWVTKYPGISIVIQFFARFQHFTFASLHLSQQRIEILTWDKVRFAEDASAYQLSARILFYRTFLAATFLRNCRHCIICLTKDYFFKLLLLLFLLILSNACILYITFIYSIIIINLQNISPNKFLKIRN